MTLSITDNLEMAAEPFLTLAGSMIDAAKWQSNDPAEQVEAFIAAQLIEVRSRTRQYIAAVALRVANARRAESGIPDTDPVVPFPGSVRTRGRFGGCDGDAA